MSLTLKQTLPQYRPIYSDEPSKDLHLPVTIDSDKSMKSRLLSIQSILNSMQSTFKGAPLNQIEALKTTCDDVLEDVCFQPKIKDKQHLNKKINTLISQAHLALGQGLLEALKRDFISLIKLKEIDPNAHHTSREDIFTEANKSKSETYYELLCEIGNSWKRIQEEIATLDKEILFLQSISKFIQLLTKAQIENLKLASNLRTLRLTAGPYGDYESPHSSTKLMWARICTDVEAVIQEKSLIRDNFTLNSLKEPINNINNGYDHHRLETTLAKFDNYLQQRLKPANQALAFEIARGADALTRKKDFPNNFKDAFLKETVYNAVSMMPSFLTSWNTPTDAPPPISYISPFDKT